jgi:hypothetical protein
MKSLSGQLALAVAGAALLTTAAYAQAPSGAVHSDTQSMVHHRIHHAHSAYDRHAYHTGTAHAAAIYNQAAGYGGSYAFNGSHAQPLYDVYNAAVLPMGVQPGVACVGGRGVGYYPNPVSYDDSAATIESGGEFTLERGYPGCYGFFGE